MATTTYVTEWRNGAPAKLHIIATPEFRDPGFYRQTASLNAFRRNIHAHGSKLIMARSPATRFHVRWADEFAMDMGTEARTIEMFEAKGKTYPHDTGKLPRAVHADAKAFYAAIGYDPKKRKVV